MKARDFIKERNNKQTYDRYKHSRIRERQKVKEKEKLIAVQGQPEGVQRTVVQEQPEGVR